MRLLITTQVVDKNDQILGFFHGWIDEFAKNFEQVTVIGLKVGEHDLPENVNILSLGKEKGVSKFKYVARFLKYIWLEKDNYDAVFVHMNQIYVIFGGLFWKFWDKRIALWYMHKDIRFSLRIAEKLVDRVFSGSKKSFRVRSKKLLVTGHGIDTNKFVPGEKIDGLKIVTVGRISRIKNVLFMCEAMKELKDRGIGFSFEIVGAAVTDNDKKYFEEVKQFIVQNNLEIDLVGSVSQRDLVGVLHRNNLFLNLSNTGSLDKAILEAMSCGLTVITSNEAFAEFMPIVGLNKDEIVEAIQNTKNKNMREWVEDNHSLIGLITKIKKDYESH